MELDAAYWDQQYRMNKAGWDIGYVSPPLKAYFDQLTNKDLKILIPGAGNGYEAAYLNKRGFRNVFMLDFSSGVISAFKERNPEFPEKNIIRTDFFQHDECYDLIIEQTFFTSIPRSGRKQYAEQMNRLLNKGGKLTGLLFNHEFEGLYPPYGGTEEEYRKLFKPYFEFLHFEIAYNSIKPRKGREFFICLKKKD